MTWKTMRKSGDGSDGSGSAVPGGMSRRAWDGRDHAEMLAGDAPDPAEQLLARTWRTTALTLEAALSRVRPLRRDVRGRFYGLDEERLDGGDVVATAYDMMALSRLSLQSAERLNGVVAALVEGGRSGQIDGQRTGAGH